MHLRHTIGGALLLGLVGCSALPELATQALTGATTKPGIEADASLQIGGQSQRAQADLGVGQVGSNSTTRNEVENEIEGSHNAITNDTGNKKYVLVVEGGQVNLRVDEAPSPEVILLRGLLLIGTLVAAGRVYLAYRKRGTK